MQLILSFDTLFSANLAPILIKALIVGVLTATCASILGVPLVLKRYSMIGDGLSHMGFCALAIATAIGVREHQIYITMPLVVLAAIGLLLLSENGKIKGDAAIAMLSTGSVAAGYIIYSIANKGAGDVCTSLFGSSILALNDSDVTLSAILAVGVILAFILLYPKIFAVTFDTAFARSAGTPVTFFNILLAVLTAVTIVVGMKMIGAIMISALIVFPALAAMRVCKHFKLVIVTSCLISVFCFVFGLVFATVVQFRFGHVSTALPIGPCVVCFNVLALLVCTLIRKLKEIANGRRSAAAQKA